MGEHHSEYGWGWQPAPSTKLNPKQFDPHIYYEVGGPSGRTTNAGANVNQVHFRASEQGDKLGHLEWSGTRGEILDVHVNKEVRRKGVATAMYKAAKEIALKTDSSEPMHSSDRSDQGESWAKSTKEPLPPRMPRIRV